jgi:hypothetical protein
MMPTTEPVSALLRQPHDPSRAKAPKAARDNRAVTTEYVARLPVNQPLGIAQARRISPGPGSEANERIPALVERAR